MAGDAGREATADVVTADVKYDGSFGVCTSTWFGNCRSAASRALRAQRIMSGSLAYGTSG